MPRKQPEPPPPGRYLRSKNGVPARLVKTQNVSAADEWLYRLDFGRVIGTDMYTVGDLLAHGATFLADRPEDLLHKLPKYEDEERYELA